jgi:phage repressor protein C with HTH and peptisase S24 domain
VNQEFKGIIADIKHKYSLTQAQIAEILGVSRPYISEVINGRAPFNDTLKAKIEEVFPDYKMSYEEPEPEPNTVPLLPIFAQAGHLTEWSEGVDESKCERVISPVKGIDMAIHIYGESMSPDIPNGSVCYVRRVTGKVIDYGRAYILDTVDGPVVKYLRPGSDDNHILCQSANSDPKFAPYEVEKSDILGMYRVVMCMKMM